MRRRLIPGDRWLEIEFRTDGQQGVAPEPFSLHRGERERELGRLTRLSTATMSRAIYLPAPSHRRQGLHSLAYPGLLTDLSLADAAYHHSTTYYSRIVARGLRLWTDGTVTPMVPSFLFVNYHRYCQPFTARRAKANLDLNFWREYFVADYYRSRTYLEVRCNHHLEPDSVFPALSGQQASPWTTLEIGNRSANGKGCDSARTEGMEETKERKKQKSLRLSTRLSLCTLIRIRENRPGIFFYNPFFLSSSFFPLLFVHFSTEV